MIKILILTNLHEIDSLKIFLNSIVNNIILYSNQQLSEYVKKISLEEIYHIGKVVDFIIFFTLNPLTDNNLILKLSEINRNEITICIDWFKYKNFLNQDKSIIQDEICIYGNSDIFDYTKSYFDAKLKDLNYPTVHMFSFDKNFYYNYKGNIKIYLVDNPLGKLVDEEYYKNIINPPINHRLSFFSFGQVNNLNIISNSRHTNGTIEDLPIDCKQKLYDSLYNEKVKFSSLFKCESIKSDKNSVIFLIPSIINIDKKNNRSIYTPMERLQQTLKQVKSIKQYVPESIIIVLEMSNMNLDEINTLYPYIDYICLYTDDHECYRCSSIDPNKNKGEIYVLKHMVNLLANSTLDYSHFIKFGGRYSLHANFKISDKSKDKPSFKIIKHHDNNCCNRSIIEAVLYTIPFNYTKIYLDIINRCSKIVESVYTDVEHLLYELFTPYEIEDLEYLHVYGNMAGSGVYRYL